MPDRLALLLVLAAGLVLYGLAFRVAIVEMLGGIFL